MRRAPSHAVRCEVCGAPFEVGAILEGIIGLSLFYRDRKPMRWPWRKRSAVRCYECGWLCQVACEVSRTVTE